MNPSKRFLRADARGDAHNERGAALFITLILLVAVVAISAGAVVLTGTERQLRIYSKTQVDLRYFAEMAAEMGLSRLNRDEQALPDTGYNILEYAYVPEDAFGNPMTDIAMNIYAARSGSATGFTGNFASVVGQAGGKGGTVIVRLEITEESFAKFAYFTDNEGGNIWFGGGDQLLGPVHSNDQIKIHSTGATFHSDVTTASTVLYPENGVFMEGYQEAADSIPMPDQTDLNRLQALAAQGNYSFQTPSVGGPDAVEMRIEFIAIDVNGDGDDVDSNEGFFRIYRANDPDWLGARNDGFWRERCGDVHMHPMTGAPWFISARNHQRLFNGDPYSGAYGAEVANWIGRAELRHGLGGSNWGGVFGQSVTAGTSRCHLGGDPLLTMDDRTFDGWNGTGFDDGWLRRQDFAPGATIPVALQGRDDADFLFPLGREYNIAFRGIIYFDGLVGVSGVLNGRITLVSNNNIVLLDDFTYSVPANAEQCNDIMGFLANRNFYIADNNLNTPHAFPGVSGGLRTYDDTSSEFLDGIILALDQSFTVENYYSGPSDAEDCEGQPNGRGCLYLTGGLIQEVRGAVGLSSGRGYIKRYAYDANARFCPPPHYPTTGRYSKNRYYEVNPQAFDDVAAFFIDLN